MLWVETDEEYKFAGDMDDGKHMGVLLGEYISILSSMQKLLNTEYEDLQTGLLMPIRCV